MGLKANFAKKMLEEEKWQEDISVYRTELLKIIHPFSRGYEEIGDLPALSAKDDSDVRR